MHDTLAPGIRVTPNSGHDLLGVIDQAFAALFLAKKLGKHHH